ncbi:MAG: peptidase domain-containing ABC transporter [Minicystis sp.]
MAEAGKPRGLFARFRPLRRLGSARRTIPFVQQLAATDCGVACLAMVLGYHGRHIGLEELRDLMTVGRDGINARDILNGARYYGLRGRGVRIELRALELLGRASILHWGLNHFVVFDRLVEGGVEILDPAHGRLRVSMEEMNRSFTGIALLLEPSESFHAGDTRKLRGRYLVDLLRRSGAWARVAVTSVFLQTLLVAFPLLTGTVVDRVVPHADRHLLVVLSAALGLIVVFHFLASMVRSHLLLELRMVVDVRMTFGFLEHLTALPYAFFQRRSAGDLLMRLNSNVVIRQILTSSALSGMLDGLMMAVYLLLAVFVDRVLAAVAVAVVLLQVAVFMATSARRKELNTQLLARQARSQGYQVEMFTGMETLKAMGVEERAQEQWSNLFVDVLNVSLAEGRLGATVDALTSTLRMGGPVLVLAIGVARVLDGKLSLGSMLAVNAFVAGVFAPLSNLIATAVQLQLLGSYVERITDVLETPPEQDRERVRPARRLRGHIEVDDVSFRYGPMEPPVLREVSVKIEPGQFVALVGRSGSGKSTLASLLLGLHPPTSGRILYDGEHLDNLDLRSVRRQLGIVTQRAHLFSTTIRANISIADPDLPMEAVVEAATLAQVHDEIARMPMSYGTLLLDGGNSIAGGQRQRIALARALVHKPAILLLDEATSALDAISERGVHEALEALSCTRIVIAHRLSTVAHADVILVMEDGRIVEQGKHAELIEKGGVYAALVASQLGSAQPGAE